MIWIAILLLALAAMVPLVATLFRPVVARGRREADLALYRAQLAELDREAAAAQRIEQRLPHSKKFAEVRHILQEHERTSCLVRQAQRLEHQVASLAVESRLLPRVRDVLTRKPRHDAVDLAA